MFALHHNEHILVKTRRHWFVLFRKTASIVVVYLILVALAFAGVYFWDTGGRALLLAVFFSLLLGLAVWMSLFMTWMNYYLDVWVMTDKRVFDIEQHSLFTRDVAEFRLDKVQDLGIEVRGLIPTILDFGDVHVQTAGRSTEFIIEEAPKPYELAGAMSREVDRVLRERDYETFS